MISFASASEWDNGLRYEKNDMKVTLENWAWVPFFGDDLGTAELKSHKSINHILEVAPGEDRVTMYYDINFKEIYKDGLGEVEFINMTDGEIIEKDYHFVVWKTITEEGNNYSKVCSESENDTTYCDQVLVGTYQEEYEGWVEVNTQDIPKGIVRIGLATDVNLGDTIDGIWTIAGKRIEKHASWTTSLNVDLIAYFKLNETSGTTSIDSIGTFNLTESGTSSTPNHAGIINGSWDFNTNNDFLVSSINTGIVGNNARTISGWVNPDSIATGQLMGIGFGSDNDEFALGWNSTLGIYLTAFGANDLQGNGVMNVSNWSMLTVTYDGSNLSLWFNGAYDSSKTATLTTINEKIRISTRESWGTGANAKIDEVSIWNRSLTSSEITQLYNDGNAITQVEGLIAIVLNSPENNSLQLINSDIILNATASSINTLQNMSLYINGTLNETKSLSGNLDTETFNKSFSTLGQYNWTIESCDNVECVNSETRTFKIKDFLFNSATLNSTSFETATETFILNVSGDISSASASLFYNGTEYTTTRSGQLFTRTIQIPVGQIGNNTIFWRLNGVEDTDNSYQNVSETIFTLCNATYPTTFLNISFKDESDLSIINATIPTSTFVYYLGDGTVTKTLTFINNSVNFNYEFCATPNRTLTVNSLIQYKQGSEYPQRIFSQTEASLTNTTTNLTLYLLGVSDGLFVTFQVFGGQSAALEGVSVGGTRILEGSAQSVAQGTTDAAGTVTFWINPDFLHTFTYIKTGFETVIESLFPTQTLYTVTMGGGAAEGINDTAEGIQITILPQGSFLDVNTFYTFTYRINSSSLTLDEFGFELFYNNGTSIHSDSSTTTTGGTLTKSFNTSNETRLTMTYYYITDGNRIDQSTFWLIYAPNDFSVYHFLTRVGTYISADMYGVLGDDEGYFAKAMLSIVVLILVTGTISFNYGLSSESAVTGLLFGVIFMLNMFNLIPTPDFLNFIELGDFLVFVVAIVTVSRILKEERR